MTTPAEAVRAALGVRIARARRLAETEPATADILRFFAELCVRQQALLDHAPRVLSTGVARAFAERFDLDTLTSLGPAFARDVAVVAAPGLASGIIAVAAGGPTQWRSQLGAAIVAPRSHGDTGGVRDDDVAAFLADALMQPFAETAAAERTPHVSSTTGDRPSTTPATCPCCGDLPVVGVLREQGHGSGRWLVCGRCLTEWPTPRLVCPWCGAVDVQAMPVYRAEAWPAARLDACEPCRSYLKSFDLTRDGQVVPLVDDLATLPLDLWATEQRFIRRRHHLLRV